MHIFPHHLKHSSFFRSSQNFFLYKKTDEIKSLFHIDINICVYIINLSARKDEGKNAEAKMQVHSSDKK